MDDWGSCHMDGWTDGWMEASVFRRARHSEMRRVLLGEAVGHFTGAAPPSQRSDVGKLSLAEKSNESLT